jgi:hypothetical protein
LGRYGLLLLNPSESHAKKSPKNITGNMMRIKVLWIFIFGCFKKN